VVIERLKKQANFVARISYSMPNSGYAPVGKDLRIEEASVTRLLFCFVLFSLAPGDLAIRCVEIVVTD